MSESTVADGTTVDLEECACPEPDLIRDRARYPDGAVVSAALCQQCGGLDGWSIDDGSPTRRPRPPTAAQQVALLVTDLLLLLTGLFAGAASDDVLGPTTDKAPLVSTFQGTDLLGLFAVVALIAVAVTAKIGLRTKLQLSGGDAR
jgi:hypothetical protein